LRLFNTSGIEGKVAFMFAVKVGWGVEIWLKQVLMLVLDGNVGQLYGMATVPLGNETLVSINQKAG
jgi:hypothetical protein